MKTANGCPEFEMDNNQHDMGADVAQPTWLGILLTVWIGRSVGNVWAFPRTPTAGWIARRNWKDCASWEMSIPPTAPWPLLHSSKVVVDMIWLYQQVGNLLVTWQCSLSIPELNPCKCVFVTGNWVCCRDIAINRYYITKSQFSYQHPQLMSCLNVRTILLISNIVASISRTHGYHCLWL